MNIMNISNKELEELRKEIVDIINIKFNSLINNNSENNYFIKKYKNRLIEYYLPLLYKITNKDKYMDISEVINNNIDEMYNLGKSIRKIYEQYLDDNITVETIDRQCILSICSILNDDIEILGGILNNA